MRSANEGTSVVRRGSAIRAGERSISGDETGYILFRLASPVTRNATWCNGKVNASQNIHSHSGLCN